MGRFGTAWKAFWKILGSQEAADHWTAALSGTRTALPETGEAAAASTAESPAAADAVRADAVYTLVLLQREGRLIDFLKEDIAAFSDAQVGAAVRQIHAGCARVLADHFEVTRIQEGSEGETAVVPADFDSRQIRVTGHPAGEPPFSGTLRHGGWRVGNVVFPDRHRDLDPTVICPAEVEV